MQSAVSLPATLSLSHTDDLRSLLPPRPACANKGDFGRVLCVCGSPGMAGAAALCAKAAYRMGAGIVEIFAPESNRIILQTLLPEAVLTVYHEEDRTEQLLLDALQRATTVVIGCGLGITSLSRRLLSCVLHNLDTTKTPLIIDADGLNILAASPSLLRYAKGAIITPHPKEFSRLSRLEMDEILADPLRCAFSFASDHSLTCVLKLHESIICDGSPIAYLNKTGNCGMATGGSGDVLAGMLAGLLAQYKTFSLCHVALAVYIHGACGDLASASLSSFSVMATDIINCIPKALLAIL